MQFESKGIMQRRRSKRGLCLRCTTPANVEPQVDRLVHEALDAAQCRAGRDGELVAQQGRRECELHLHVGKAKKIIMSAFP